jgi:5S rRNA maturation endonuclease (ribonuclease M5)
MKFFYKYFGRDSHINDNGEMFVNCPFPHFDENGKPYMESNPSSHINLDRSTFHCKVCGKGMSEAAFLSKLQGISYKEALILLETMSGSEDIQWEEERKAFLNSEEAQSLAKQLGIFEVHEELQLGYESQQGGISFPVFIYNDLLDARNYVPDREAKDGRSLKVLSRKKAKPLILPFDVWIEDDRPTILAAGEKDMAILRTKGFNAITFTGGEQSVPKLFKASFRGKQVFIPYDNDQAGREGAYKVASHLKEWGAFPHVVEGHYTVCTEKGEDIHDFFQKYNKTATDLQKILDETPEFTEEMHQKERAKRIPVIRLEDAMDPQYRKKYVSSHVSVVSVFEEVYQIPDYVEYDVLPDDGIPPHKINWTIGDKNLKDILYLMDNKINEQKQYKELLRLAWSKYEITGTRILSSTNIYKAVITDTIESSSDKEEVSNPREILVYIIGKRLDPGKKYFITYQTMPNPHDQRIVGIVNAAEDSSSSVSNFKMTKEVMESLEPFKLKDGQTVNEKMSELFERGKSFTGVEARKDITYGTDLFYHTPLDFKFNNKVHRATLDVMIVGDERTGKSKTAKEMLNMYELGVIASLKTSTEASIVGGSDSTSGGWKTKLGVLPRNHKGAVILEEFSGGGKDLISRLTEIRSSQRVRIGRVNGTLEAEAKVRMLSISNPATNGGNSTPVRNYPNGTKIILDLIGANEDIARYDYFILVAATDNYISPLASSSAEPIPKEAYMNRIRWVWSRTPEQVELDRDIMESIVAASEDLNRAYDCHIKLFGPETWMKLARIAIASAGLTCSMDETGEKIVVTESHVLFAKNFLKACYDNEVFRLGEYVRIKRKTTELDDTAVPTLQGIYNQHAIMLQQLEMESEMSRQQLEAVSGMERKEFNRTINALVRGAFIELKGERMQPTVRFRKAMKMMGEIYPSGVGEV